MKGIKNQIGVLYVILSAVLFGTMPLLAQTAYAHGSNSYTVAFTRFLFGGMVLGIVVSALPGCSIKIGRGQLLSLIKLSAPYALTPVLLYASYTHIDSGMATTLHFTYPIAVMLIMVVFCKARLTARQILCAVFCVGGMALLYTPGGKISMAGVLLAVVSGIAFAIYIVLLGRSAAKALHPLVLAFWVSLLSTVEIGAIALFSGNLVFRLDAVGWAAEAGMALAATVFALVLFQKGVILCGEVKASLFSTFEPLTGIVIGVLVFQEALTAKEVVGMAGILAAAVLLVLPVKERQRAE